MAPKRKLEKEHEVEGVAKERKKMVWRCVVPQCPGNSKVLRHSFPKDSERSQKWVDAVNNPALNGNNVEELRSHYVCALHFADSAYRITGVRRVLKENAVSVERLGPSTILSDVTATFSNLSNIRPSETYVPPVTPAVDTDRVEAVKKIKAMIQESQDEGMEVEFLDSATDIGWNVLPSVVGHETTAAEENESDPPNNFTPIAPTNSSKVASDIRTTPKRNRRPLLDKITRKKNLTPVASRLHATATRLLKQQSQTTRRLGSFKERLQKAEKFIESVDMKDLQALSPEQLKFIEMHVRNVHKKKNARRFTTDDKVLAFAIYKQSPQCYRLLSRIFILPTPRSLRMFMQKISLKPGVNKIIFEHLKEQGKTMKKKDKVCFLLWDEVSLDAQIYYDEKEDAIVGFEDWGNKRTNKIADYALVFMLRGINRNWKIPVTYNFCKGATSGVQLIRCVKEIVRAVKLAGFQLVATVCDQGSPNVNCINGLLKETRDNCVRKNKPFTGRIQLCGFDIIPLFDPPHLIKGIRKNFLTKLIELLFPKIDEKKKKSKEYLLVEPFLVSSELKDKLQEKCETTDSDRYFATWKTIEDAYDIDTKSVDSLRRNMPKLTDGHVRRDKIKKMRVYQAVQVLSRSVAHFIRFLSTLKGTIETMDGEKSMPKKEGLVTSEALKFFNDTFDSLNGRAQEKKESRNELRRQVTNNSCHPHFWKEAANCIDKNIRFVHRNTKKNICVHSLKNLRTTLLGFNRLWQQLKKLGFKSFAPRNVNQDPLENFFGMIRSHGRRNINPTCSQFSSSFKSLLINNLTCAATVRGNCQNDEATPLFSLRNLVETADTFHDNDLPVTDDGKEKFVVADFDSQSNNSDIYVNYKKVLFDLPRTESCCSLSMEVKRICQNNDLLKDIHTILESNIPLFCFKRGISTNLALPLEFLFDFSQFHCEDHDKNVLINKMCKLLAIEFVKTWCKKINKLLKGKESGDRIQSSLMKAARIQYQKTLHKKNRDIPDDL